MMPPLKRDERDVERYLDGLQRAEFLLRARAQNQFGKGNDVVATELRSCADDLKRDIAETERMRDEERNRLRAEAKKKKKKK